MNVFSLKMLACISMLFDHVGVVFFPDKLWMRYLGRFAFPIYAFLLAEGYHRTKNVIKYLSRLMTFAIISEIPFDLALKKGLFVPDKQNVYFTLFLGLLMLYLIDRTESYYMKALIIVSVMLIAQAIQCDYRYPGIWMILSFAFFRDFPALAGINFMSANIKLFKSKVQATGVLALIPISLYNGEKGPSWTYFFYSFYPAHLLIIYLLKHYVFVSN